MINSVSSTRLKGISRCFLKLGHWKAGNPRLAGAGNVESGGPWSKVLCRGCSAVKPQGQSASSCPLAGPRHSGAPLLWSRQSTFTWDLVSPSHINKQLSKVSKSPGASLPGCRVLFCYSFYCAILGYWPTFLSDL